MATKSKEQLIDEFTAITQCSRELAVEHLRIVDWDVQAAVTLFFDSSPYSDSNSDPSTSSSTYLTSTDDNTIRMYHFICYNAMNSEACLFFVFVNRDTWSW